MLLMLLCFGLCAKFFICFVHLYACTSVIIVIFLYGSKAVYFLSSVDPPVVRVTGGGQVKQGSYVTLTCDVISGSQSGPIRYAWTYNGRNRNSRLESDVVVSNNRIRWGSDKETKDLEKTASCSTLCVIESSLSNGLRCQTVFVVKQSSLSNSPGVFHCSITWYIALLVSQSRAERFSCFRNWATRERSLQILC